MLQQFNKGRIAEFDTAITSKLKEILDDAKCPSRALELFGSKELNASVDLRAGSCLDILPTLKARSIEAIITSPPYCNRYDYTRTYALELALLGVNEDGLVSLRQHMLSCTVENREKDLLLMNKKWAKPIDVANHQGVAENTRISR